MLIRTSFRVIAAASLAATVAFEASQAQAPRFEVTIDPAARATPLTGRLVVVVSKTAQPEPRMIIAPQGPAVFAIDLDQLRAGQTAVVDAQTSLGYPMPLAQLPAGEYYAQCAELVRQMGAHVKQNTPAGDDATAWWY